MAADRPSRGGIGRTAGSHGKVFRMKINTEIDCTPEEARHFFGLPEGLQPRFLRKYA
jgi:hypothetical protein